jgi:light-regulated signal transduction histidine kinase (bacteriophytochrome)
VLPLDTGAEYVGARSIYSGVSNAFPEYEVEMLKRLAANLSFAARDIRSQEARKKAEKEIRELNADLENRVVQRTEEINKLNIELQSNVKDLEVANKDLESFSYTVSHDLRAPLRNINGYISLLERGNNSLSAESTKYLASISGLTKKMGLLIDDLLAFAKVGKKELVKTNIDMNALLADALESVNVLEWNSHTTLKAGNMLPANGDYNLLKQVFVNLLSNAIKYSHTKENPVVEVGSYGNENENTYYVKDNGVGFSMEYHDKLFKVFQRLHSSSEFEGIGIGLAIAQRIVMKHDGKVGAESKEGEGATFYFTLPAVLNPETSV